MTDLNDFLPDDHPAAAAKPTADLNSFLPDDHPASQAPAAARTQQLSDATIAKLNQPIAFNTNWQNEASPTPSAGPDWLHRVGQDVSDIWSGPLGGTHGALAKMVTVPMDVLGRTIDTGKALAGETAASAVPDAVYKAMGFDPATGRAKMARDTQNLVDAAIIESGRDPYYLGGDPAAIDPTRTNPVQAAMNVGSEGAGTIRDAAAYAGNKVGNVAGDLAANVISGLGTHTGADSIKQAAAAGFSGGDQAKIFLDNLRRNANPEDVIDAAKGAVAELRRDRNAAYKLGMVDVGKDATVLDFGDIDSALQTAKDMNYYKGVPKNADPSVFQNIADEVSKWKNLDPAEYHTPEGIDALKQKLGTIKDETKPGTVDRATANTVYNAVRKTIADQAPAYDKTMQDYAQASDLVKQLEGSLSLKEGALNDTTLRKLQSVMRNNVNTNYGYRMKMAQQLNEINPEIMPALAGQSLSSWLPRGLAGAFEAPATVGAGLLGHPGAVPFLAMQSPRLVGEAAYGAGRFAKGVSNAAGYLPSAEELGAAAFPQVLLNSAQQGITGQPTTFGGQNK